MNIRLVDNGTELGSMVCVMPTLASAATAAVKRRYCMIKNMAEADM